ncbi:hypothetical protein NLJ89_g10701 [Agrocybe chaxingu]|uniref:Uncharacterized protein n=1 Tax=Agrocybe chaxingu TaxID=84603 RepID=A0A9W8JQR6_9AGAR|nr:hypothetical protein NLJ89_g10701 [Agrocybe chaxingu]
MSPEIDAKLFPVPSHFCYGSKNTTVIRPRVWAGVTPASTEILRRVLTDNHRRWHVIYDDIGFHNHIPHAVLTLWCLGADASLIEASYKTDSAYQRPIFTPPRPISRDNWMHHLVSILFRYYVAYLQFFKEEFKTKSFKDMLQEYVFDYSANYVENAQKQPQMLARFLASLLHPLIHIGFGIEFGLPGVLLEGEYW